MYMNEGMDLKNIDNLHTPIQTFTKCSHLYIDIIYQIG